MITENKLDRVFGPIGSSAGIPLFVAGLIITYFSWTGLFLVLIGAFVGFTSTSALVDYEKRRLKFTNRIFGIFPVGKWVVVDKSMKIGIKKSNKVWRAYSRSNRPLDIADSDYRMILYDANGREIMPIQKFDSIDLAKSGLEKFCNQFGLDVM